MYRRDDTYQRFFGWIFFLLISILCVDFIRSHDAEINRWAMITFGKTRLIEQQMTFGELPRTAGVPILAWGKTEGVQPLKEIRSRASMLNHLAMQAFHPVLVQTRSNQDSMAGVRHVMSDVGDALLLFSNRDESRATGRLVVSVISDSDARLHGGESQL